MLRTDCCGEMAPALHVPHQPEDIEITMLIGVRLSMMLL